MDNSVVDARVFVTPTPLGPLTTLGVGGAARLLAVASSEQDVLRVAERAAKMGLPLLPLGGGSNVVVADSGVNAVVLSVQLGGVELVREGSSVLATVGAGVRWDQFAADMAKQGIQGVECLAGIPGSVGATPIQNVGAYGQEVSEALERVQVFDGNAERVRWLSAAECQFGYRDSYFKREGYGRYVVLGVQFRLTPGGPPKIRYGELERALHERRGAPSLLDVRSAVLELRRNKSMLLDHTDENGRSCGSFFVNPQLSAQELDQLASRAAVLPPAFATATGQFKFPAAWLIERAGLSRGTRRGSVGLSTKHTLALVAHAGATAADVVAFAHEVRARVMESFGIKLVPEPCFWGFAELDAGLPVLKHS